MIAGTEQDGVLKLKPIRTVTVATTTQVSVDVEVDVPVKEVLDGMTHSEKQALVSEMLPHFDFEGELDRERAEIVIEAAYLAAKRMPEVPRAVADLFWLVHNRAL